MVEPHYIYCAGPYSSEDPEQVSRNVQQAVNAAQALVAKGHFAFCPHSHTHGWEANGELGYEDFMRLALAWLRKCDWFLYLGPSPGADRELAEARKHRKVIFFSIEEVPPVAEA